MVPDTPWPFYQVSSRVFSPRGQRKNGRKIVLETRVWCVEILLYWQRDKYKWCQTPHGLSARSLLAFFRPVASGKMDGGLFWKLECGALRICFIGKEIHTNGARHPLAPLGLSARSLLAFFRPVASGKMDVKLCWKLECGALRICFIGKEINTNGARHPMASACAAGRSPVRQFRFARTLTV